MARKKGSPSNSAPPQHDEQATPAAEVQAKLNEAYLITPAPNPEDSLTRAHTEYRFKDEASSIAFTASAFRLETGTNSPSVAHSMVDLAETRGWRSLKLSGHEEFKRLVWMEASMRGVKAIGYEATAADLHLVRDEQAARRLKHAESSAVGAANAAVAEGANAGGRGRNSGPVAEAVIVARGVPEQTRERVMTTRQRAQPSDTKSGTKVLETTTPHQGQTAALFPELERDYEPDAPAR